jgi:hypothetical protein
MNDSRPPGQRRPPPGGDPKPEPVPEPKNRFPIEMVDDIELGVETGGLIGGLLHEGETSMGYGETGAAKSFLAVSLGFHVALGWQWFGRQVIRGGAIYVAAEGGERIRRRFVAFKKYFAERYQADLSLLGPTPFGVINTEVDLLNPEADVADLALEINRKAATFSVPLRLIFIDTVSATLAGGDENKPDVMGTFLRNVKRLKTLTAHPETGNPHAHLVHHPGKDPTKGDRGHYSARATMDTRWEVIKPPSEMVGLFRILKQRDGLAGEEFGFRLEVVELGEDINGRPITSCVVLPTTVPEHLVKPKEKKLPAEYQRALDFLCDVVAEIGELLDKPGYPNVRAVTLDQWRERLKLRGLYDGNDAASRNWFKRVKARLIGERLVTIDGDLLWPVPRR